MSKKYAEEKIKSYDALNKKSKTVEDRIESAKAFDSIYGTSNGSGYEERLKLAQQFDSQYKNAPVTPITMPTKEDAIARNEANKLGYNPTIETLNNAAKSMMTPESSKIAANGGIPTSASDPLVNLAGGGYANTNTKQLELSREEQALRLQALKEKAAPIVNAFKNSELNKPSNYIQGIADKEFNENVEKYQKEQQELQDYRAMVENYVNNPDFEENSIYDPNRYVKSDYATTPDSFEDWLLNAGTGKFKGKRQGSPSPYGDNASIVNGESKLGMSISNLNEDQRKLYNYIRNTEGENNADKYLKSIMKDLNAQTRVEDEARFRDLADESKFGASALSVVTSPLKIPAVVANTVSYALTGQYDENAPINMFSYGNTALRDEVSKDWGTVGKFLYGTGMSMADNLFNMAITGGLSAIAGGEKLTWDVFRMAMASGEGSVLALMGTEAAADALIKAKDDGYDDQRAMTLGLLAGAVEIITEKIGMDALFDFKTMDASHIKYWLQATLSEGGEEGLADILNWAADGLYAALKGTNDSEWDRMIQEYMAQGYTEEEAFSKAWVSRISELGQDIAGGALSGGVMAGGGVAINRVNQYNKARQISNDLEQGINSTNEGERIYANLVKNAYLDDAKSTGSDKLQNLVVEAEENGEVSKQDTIKILYELQKENEYNAMKTQQVAEGVESVLGIENENFANEIVKQYDTNQNGIEFIKDAKAIQNAVANNLELNEVELSTMNLAQAEAVYNTIKVGEEDGNQLHGSSKWDDSKSARGQNGSLAEKSGEIKAEYQIDSRAKDSHVKSVTLAQEVIQESRQLTLKNGKTITTAPVREVVGNFTAPMKRAVSRAEKAGYKVRFFVGDYLIETDQTGEGRRRATINAETKEIWLKADDSQFASDQVVIHELTHPKLWVDEKAGIPSKFREDLKSKLQESLGEKLYDQLLLVYLQANANADLTSIDQFKSSDIQYYEDEMLCDLNAGMNVFNGTSFTATARLVESKLGSIRAAVNSVEDNKAPPTTSGEMKFSSVPFNPRELNEDSQIELITNAVNGLYEQKSYVPVKAHTPSLLIENAKANGIEIYDYPMAMQVLKIQQANEDIDDIEDGKKTHGLSDSDIVKIINAMENPESIYYQNNNGRLNTIVKIKGKKGEIFAIVELNNWKKEIQLNGYTGGIYNIVVTTFAPDSNYIKNYKNNEDNVEIYNKKRNSQVTSGSNAPSVLNEISSTDSKPNSATDVNSKKSYSSVLDVEDSINQSMTMQQAKRMIEIAFIDNDIYDLYDGQYKNGVEWLKGEGVGEVGTYVAYTDASDKFLDPVYDRDSAYRNREYNVFDILQAYLDGTLTGKVEKSKKSQLDLSKDTGYKDERFYAPKTIEEGKELYQIANQRVTKENIEAVNRARAAFIINAHNQGYAESLGLTQKEVNAKLKAWAGYPAKALKLSNRLNEGVARQNKWAGLENSSIVNKSSVTNEELAKLVKDIKGDNNGWQRKYITATMLALDTHIDYSGLTFEFDKDAELGRKALGNYNPSTDTIRIGKGYLNTVAHEIGHYIDRQWARDLGIEGKYLSDHDVKTDNLSPEQKQFVENFKEFFRNIEENSYIGNVYSGDASYWQHNTEIFARFIGAFTEWVRNQATGNQYRYEADLYQDNFTTSQFEEFVKILQQKAMLDTTGGTKYSYDSSIKHSSVLDNQVSLDDLLLELAQTNKTKAENFAARLTDAGEQIGMNLVFIPTSELSVGDTETVAVTSKPETKAEVKSETKTETKTPAKKKTVTKTSKTDNKINDFGNKIGGARKDLWREKGLGIQDLAGMNEAEKGKFITKDNIWNKVDYQALVDSGIARDVVYFRKQLRDALPTSPYIKYNATEEEKQTARENYIEFITSVRSAVENIKTKEDAEAFFENYFVKSGLYDRRTRRTSNDQVTSKFFSTSQNARNWKWYIEAPMAKAQFLVPKEQKLPKGIEIIYEEGGIGTSLKPGTYFVVKDSHFIIATDFESREAAYKWVQDTMGTKETSDRKKKFVPPQLTDIHRVGRDVRNNNRKNITGQDYLDTFGFYGGEFGNWLNESDRQFSLNYGYDALIDLADALGISEKDISLGGKLSIAFGSRGVKGAAAHFEPLRKVINLTKMNGAGSLAHEWGHALDNIIADELGLKKYMTEESYKLPGRLKTVVNKLLDDMMYKQVEMTNEDVIAEKQKELKKYQANVRGWINRSFTQLTVDKMTDVNKRLLNQYIEEALNPTEKYWGLLAGGDATEGVVGKLNMLLKSNTGRVIPKDERHQLSLNIGRVFDLNEDIKNPETQSRRVRTDYYNQSQIMGQYHAKDGGYWTSEIEMFARAFACYVTDKLEGRQQKSDYLSAHSDAAIIIVPDKNGNPQVVKAFPVGEERLQINNDIDEFISTLIDLGYLHKGSQVVEDVVDQETGEILGEKGTYSVSRYSTVYDFDNNPTPLNRTIDSNGTELSEEQNNFFANSVVRDDAGRLMRMYHGTQRGDRVGYVFDPAKATSGSMAYFTNNRSIADNYAKNKSDTSLSRDYESYYDMFTVDGKNLTDLWKSLPYSKRAAIKAEMYNIGLDDDYENWVHEKNANANSFSRGTFDDYLRHNDNNPLYAMYRMLEDNGLPYESFTDILEFAGIEGDIAYDNPDIRNEKTYEVYLNITNPLDTSDIPESVVKDLAKETKKAQKTFKPGGNRFGDTYDKFSIPPEVWYDRLLDDIKNGTTHTWTTVPDYVTEYLKKKGYDGIKDLGGKNGGQVHEVYIPFTSNQVKEVTNLNPTSSNDIRYSSVLDSEGNKLSKTQAEYFKDSVIRDENGNLKVMYHGTHKAGFTVFDPKHSDDKISLFFTDSKENAMTYDSQGEMEFPTKEKTFENIQAEIEGITGGDWTLEERDGQYAIIDNTILDYDFDLDENGDIDFTGEKASADPDYNVVKTFDTVEEAYYGFLDEQPFKMWWLGEDVNLVYPVYLNVTNPLVVEANGNQWNEIPVPEEFHTAATKGEERLKIEYLDKATTREFSAYAKAKGYDGVVFNNIYDSGMDGEEVQSTVVIAFDSNQVKTVGNTNPTTDRDIRYSTVNETLKQNEERTAARHQTIQELTRDLEKIKADRDYWKGQTKVTKHYTLDGKATDQYTKEVLKDWSATIDPETVSKEIKRLGEYVKDTKNPDYDNWFGEISSLAYSIIESAEELANAESYQKYKEIKEYFRGKTIHVQKGDIADFNAYRKSLFGTLNLSTTSGIGIDTIWSELQEEFGRDLFPDDIINNTEMVQHVVAVLDSLNAIYENPFNYEMQEATEELAAKLAADLFDGVIRQADPTYADRMEAKIKAIREEYQQMLTDAESNEKEKIQKVRDKAKEHEKKAVRKERNRILEREKAKRERLEANLKQSVKESKQRARERKADSKMRSDLLRIAKRLNNKKLPKVNRELLNQYIGELDLIAKGMRADTQLRLENLSKEYEALQKADPLYSDEHIKDAIDRLDKKHINDLTQEEVAELTEILLSFEKEMREANQIKIHNEAVDLHKAAAESASKIRQLKGVKESRYKLNDMFLTRALSPMRFFKRIVGYDTTNPLYKVAEDLNAAERTKLQYELNANKLLREFTEDKKFMKSIRGKNAQEITLKGFWDGKIKEVKITPDMRISIYLLSRQEEALKHMEEGGLTIPDIKKYKDNKGSDAYNVRDLNSNRIRLSHQDVLRCIEGMSEKEKAFANAISKYYNEVSQPTISEVYENLMGYAMKAVDHYFPVNSDGDFLNKEVGFDESLTIGDPGWLKERKKSGNPIYLYDASQVVTKSISQHSKYIAFAEVTKQMDKLLKTQIGSVDETGNYNGYQDTILKAIRSRFGKQGEEYIPRLMKDIKGMATESDAFGDVLAKIRTNYAGAVLTLNLGVAMKQAASIPTAIAVLGYKAVFNPSNVAAFGNEKLNDIIDRYTPYHWTRRQGYSTQELGDIKNLTSSKYAITDWIRGKNLPKGLNWIQAVDVGTTRFLWKASANYVRANTNLEAGSDAFYKEVAKVYEQVITETQPNYTTMQRPDYLRSKDQLTRSMFMFKTQPFQNFNLLVDSVGEYNALKRAARLDESLKPKLQEAQKRLVTTITSQTLAAFTFAMMTMAYALMRGKKKDYEDDKGNFAPMSKLLNETLGSFAGGFVGGTELYNLISSKITGEKYYGISEVSTSSLASLIDAISTSYDIASDLITGEKSLSDVRYSMNKLVSTASKTLGVPYDNVNNILMMAYRPALKAAYGEYVGEYYMMVMTINPNSTYYRSQYYDLLYKAYKNDKNAYARLKKMFMEETGVKESTIDKKMKDLDKK